MALYLAPIVNIQHFDDSGAPLAGGKLYTYEAGTTTPLATYQDIAGASAHANPVVMDADGRPSAPIWLAADTRYKFILKTSADVELDQWDDVFGIAEGTTAPSEWLAGATPTFATGTTFTQQGDTTAVMLVGRRVRLTDSTTLYGTITAASYAAGTNKTTLTVTVDSGTSLSSSLTAVDYGFLTPHNPTTSRTSAPPNPLVLERAAAPTTPAAGLAHLFGVESGAGSAVLAVDDAGNVGQLDGGAAVLSDADETMTVYSPQVGVMTPTDLRTLTLPTTKVRVGNIIERHNASAADYLVLVPSGGSAYYTVGPGEWVRLMALQNAPTTGAHWRKVAGSDKLRVFTELTATFTADAGTDVCTGGTYSNSVEGEYDKAFYASSTTTLPAGLAASTPYYIVSASGATFKLSLTPNGAAIDITDTGTGTHTLTPQWIGPLGVNRAYASATGGGGGGGSGSVDNAANLANAGGGGGGGGTAEGFKVFAPGAVYAVGIGASGDGGAAPSDGVDGADGTAGGDSTFNGMTGSAGAAGSGAVQTSGEQMAAGGAGGAASGGTINSVGAAGGTGHGPAGTVTLAYGGHGGATTISNDGRPGGVAATGAGGAGVSGSGGGGGAAVEPNPAYAGGAGGNGEVRVYY